VKTAGLKVHFMGAAGIGMSAIAELAARRGACVSGCDLAANENSERLVAGGATFFLGHSPGHLSDRPDVLVYSSAVPQDNAELLAARRLGVEVVSRSTMLARLMQDRRSVGVAGTHGKTTTTWLCAKLLIEAGLDPAVMVGGVVPELGSNYRAGGGAWFVTEVDESDGLLLEIRPEISVLLNIDRDHLDHYGSIEAIEATFAMYAANTRADGCIVGCGDDPRVRAVAGSSGRLFVSYGLTDNVEVRGHNLRLTGRGSTFDACTGGGIVRDLEVTLVGEHNVLNALAVVALAGRLDVGEAVLRRALMAAGSVRRRLEFMGERRGVRIYNDYGHHPTEIAATLKAAGLMKDGGGRLAVVFQPHRYSRTRHLFEDFVRCFGGADHLVVASIYSANETPTEGVGAADLVERISRDGHPSVQYIPGRENVVGHLASFVRGGDLVLFLGAGDIWKLGSELLARL
jgi:UDP-N-acetylmuramate--alanine ligase